jgi:outer membrane receptor protein involved in Fe transport
MSFLQKESCLFFFLICFSAETVFSQEVHVSGKVRDQNTHREVPFVNIFIKATQIGTASDFTGRYNLRIPNPAQQTIVVFRHVAYEPRELLLDSLKAISYVDLQPRVIPLSGVNIEAPGLERLEIHKDLPQTVSVIEARNFEIRGYVDAGDLLRADHSVQVDEQLSGKKTVALRGGNADEVLVLFNGVKLNNTFDNIFDFSLIDLEDIERFEIIKGSNTALYGPEAFSGVINIVPKLQQDYTIRFQQRLGTYRSGNWGLHLYRKFDRILSSYSLKRGALQRQFVDAPEDSSKLENSSLHHTANLTYILSKDENGKTKASLDGMWTYTSLDYKSQPDADTLSNFNHLFALKYSGDLFKLRNIELFVAFKKLAEEQKLTLRSNVLQPSEWPRLNRDIDDRSLSVNAQKRFNSTSLDLLFSYQFEHSKLDYLNQRENFSGETAIGLESADLQRRHHGFASIVKYHGETSSEFLNTIDLDVSFRHDQVHDKQTNSVLRSGFTIQDSDQPGLFNNNDWQETTFKSAINVSGYRNDLVFNGYLNFGTNTKFPTLFQQISSPDLLSGAATQPNLNPEKNRSFELGAVIARDLRGNSSIYGWQVSASYFQNHYANKFRVFSVPERPVAFYDNVQNARISGFETKSSVFLFRKKIAVDLGVSKYFLSEKAAFPFKSDFKRIINFNIDHAGYSFQLHWFKESEQTAWLRFSSSDRANSFAEITLPGQTNVDLHLSKTFAIWKFKFFVNGSIRNLLNDDDLVLEGLAIRDRRFYLTIGGQY